MVSKVVPFKGLPMEYVMAFNAVSAPAYMGEGAALRIDGSLDDMPDIEVIVIARNKAELQRFHDHIGQQIDLTKSKPLATTWTKFVKVLPYSQLAAPPSFQTTPPPDDEL